MKKTIADLERYKELLWNKRESVNNSIMNHMFLLDGGEFDFVASVELAEVLSNKIDLLSYEIEVALFSNSTKVDGEDVSLKQIENSLENIKRRLKFFEKYEDEYLVKRDTAIKANAMTPYILATSLEHVEKIINSCYEEIYSLSQKLEKEKERVKIDVDMKDFVIEDLIVI